MSTTKTQPSVFLIGSGKSGTTSLYHYFLENPSLFLPPLKEPHFFAMPEFALRSGNNPNEHGPREEVVYDAETYRELYSPCRSDQLAVDCSPSYLNNPMSAERIYQFNPESRILVILRHPVERAFSAYSHLVREGFEDLSFAQGLQKEPERSAMGYGGLWRYKEHGFYTGSLKHFEKVFGHSKMKVMLFDDLVADPSFLMKEIYNFLGVESILPASFLKYNVSGEVRLRLAYNFIGRPNPVKKLIKKIFPLKLLQSVKAKTLIRLTTKLSLTEADAAALSPSYQSEITDLGAWLGRDLSEWKTRYSGD